MDILNTVRWNELLSGAMQDTSCHVLAAMVLLMLTTALICQALYGPSAEDV